MTAGGGSAASDVLRHCDLNDLGYAVEQPSNRSRVVDVTTALACERNLTLMLTMNCIAAANAWSARPSEQQRAAAAVH